MGLFFILVKEIGARPSPGFMNYRVCEFSRYKVLPADNRGHKGEDHKKLTQKMLQGPQPGCCFLMAWLPIERITQGLFLFLFCPVDKRSASGRGTASGDKGKGWLKEIATITQQG
jgi:hypothetical protein